MKKLLDTIPKFKLSTENLGEIELPKRLSSEMVIKILKYPELNDEDLLKKIMIDMNQSMGGNLINSDEEKITLGDITSFAKEFYKNPNSSNVVMDCANKIKTEASEFANKERDYIERLEKPFNHANVMNDDFSQITKKQQDDIADSVERCRIASERAGKIDTVADIFIKKNSGLLKWLAILATLGTVLGGVSKAVDTYLQYKKETSICATSSVDIDQVQTIKRPRNIIE